MTKLHEGIIKNILLLFLLCLAEIVFSGQHNSCKTFSNNNVFINPISYNFKVGDLVVFKKSEQGFLLEGKITEINQAMALVEYIDPDEPTKIKEFSTELNKLTKVEIVNNRTSLDLNLKIIFKKINSERLYEGVVIGINQTNVVVEYTEPFEPQKTKEIVVEFSKLYRIVNTDKKDEIIEKKVVQKPENNVIFKVGDYVKFKKLSSENEFEGIITVLKENIAEIEYYDPASPSIKRSIEKKTNELTKIENLTQWHIDNNLEIFKKEIVVNPDYKEGDEVLISLTGLPPQSGKIIETYKNSALIEFNDPTKRFQKTQTEVEYSKLKRQKEIEPVIEKNKKKVGKKNVTDTGFLKHTISINILQFAFKRASIWYEFKPKEWIGIRFPFYFNWSELIYSLGINPKFYFNKHKIVRGFAGAELIVGIKLPQKIPFSFYKTPTIGYFDVLADAGISINPIRNLNITANCGIGINIRYVNTRTNSTSTKFSYYPEISIGYNF